jgi:hypothetical protein
VMTGSGLGTACTVMCSAEGYFCTTFEVAVVQREMEEERLAMRAWVSIEALVRRCLAGAETSYFLSQDPSLPARR